MRSSFFDPCERRFHRSNRAALGSKLDFIYIQRMKLNSSKSIEKATKVFRSYDGSWTAAREAAHRDKSGVLVIPKKSDRDGATGRFEAVGPRGTVRRAG